MTSVDRPRPRLTTYRQFSLSDALTSRRLAGLTLAVGLIITGIGISAGPREESAAYSPTPEASTILPPRAILVNGQTVREILESSLQNPQSPMLRSFQDAHDHDGLLVTDFGDCTETPSAMPRIFTSEAKRRHAPFKNTVEIAALQPGDQFNAAIEATVRSITGRRFDERWMAEITNEGITWAALEEKYRTYAVQAWPEAPCLPFKLQTNYTLGAPPASK